MTDTSTDVASSAPELSVAAPARVRLEGLDLLRLLAICAVVILHVSAQARLLTGNDALSAITESMRWAVPSLFVVSGLLAGSGHPRGFLHSLSRRAGRLLIPYVFWTLAYFAATMLFAPTPFPDAFTWLFRGGSLYGSHLWFLMTLMLCVPFGLLITGRRTALGAAIIGAALIAARWAFHWTTPLDWGISATWTFLDWLELYMIGMALGRWLEGRQPAQRSPWILVGVSLAATAVGWGVYQTVGQAAPLGELALGATGIALALTARASMSLSKLTATLAGASLGIYVSHPMVMALFGRLVPIARLAVPAWIAVGVLVTFSVAAVASVVALRIPFVRRVVS